MSASRLPAFGSRIDRNQPLAFMFDGAPLKGFAGDTVASALLGNGVSIVGSSIMKGRPRGITSAGPEESTAIIQIEEPFPEPMLTATTVELREGLVARSLRGQGRLATVADPASYDAFHFHCELLVVGAGPAGLAAALQAGSQGVRVLLIDDRPEAGGALLTPAELAWVADMTSALVSLPSVTHLQRSTVTGYYDKNYLIAVEHRTDHPGHGLGEDAVRERIWRIRAGHVILATGAHERSIAFAGNDVPGVMLAESVRVYLHRYGVLAGDNIVVFTENDDAYWVAADLQAAGANVSVVDPRASGATVPAGFTGTVLAHSVVTGTEVDSSGTLSAVLVGANGAASGSDNASYQRITAEVLAISGGWNPAVQLFSQSGGNTVFDPGTGAFVPGEATQAISVAGSVAGTRTNAQAVRAGIAAAQALFAGDAVDVGILADTLPEASAPSAALYAVLPAGVDPRTLDGHYVDIQRDVTVAEIAVASGAGLLSVEHVKRYTTAGTAHDQGKTSGVVTSAVLAALQGVDISELGVTKFRAPYTSISFAALAGRERGDLYDPVRTTGAHGWHVEHGAEFENVGQWKRPWFYPKDGEHMDAAVRRETIAARTTVAFMDGSTLGKIDVSGPDAGFFLDMLYTNMMSTLKVGSIRYGVMCNVDGMTLDDGTVFRLATERFLVTTTTGNAAKILDWMEEWLQTEWPHLRVACTSVTEQWATMALVGPRSRSLLAALAPDLTVDNVDFPFMAWRDAVVAGLTARVARISFSGELAYEINVPWFDAAALWGSVWAAGEPIGLTPYGTETMHVLRAEKGYPIIGQDTDGTITPQDLGMGWAVSKKKVDYLGKRSHSRPENQRTDRKQLVGLLPHDRARILPEGSQLVDDRGPLTPPVAMLGHITSSYPSAALASSFALALLINGHHRMGSTVYAVVDGVPVPATVTASVLFDPEGLRRDGDPAGEPEPLAPFHGPASLPKSPLMEWNRSLTALSRRPATGVRVAEQPLTTMLNLRLYRGGSAAAALEAEFGAALPTSTGKISEGADVEFLALGPNEFLMLAGPGRTAELTSRLGMLARDEAELFAVTDVSASRTTLRISGRNARRVLAHGCALDLAMMTGTGCAQTMLAQCAVILITDGFAPGEDADQVRVLVRASFAAHLAQWLLLTAEEY
ncbi:FAD-dependent oxidoreductase [Nakamurella antarctica]|uniref:FAD-dependent oxidoreductase n=1 Tax=Nakamurella antarctica TaxID=1902245 RepID=A0A3G8ZTB7_9ACTN|nr:2Fe-2S iron-sulfur cluster-binding protein [Nakamurella antarctica]AZI57286.1 FAD-dependent oxidoreductase [Nakamurella antarctica]